MFHPGQLVICIHHMHSWAFGETTPIKGNVYTIRETGEDARVPDGLLRVREIVNPPACYDGGLCEPWFRGAYFRPITDDRLAIFRQHLVPAPSKESERA